MIYTLAVISNTFFLEMKKKKIYLDVDLKLG